MSATATQISELPGSIYDTSPDSFMGRLWAIHTAQLEYLESLENEIRMQRDPLVAGGDLLDLLGEMLRESRRGRDDEGYRAYLLIAIQRTRSNGSIADLNQILRAILGADFIEIRPLFHNQQGRFDWADDPDYRIWLNGARFMDGRWFLSGSLFQAGAIEIRIRATAPANLKRYIHEILPHIVGASALFFIKEV